MKFLKTLILILWAFNLEAQVDTILKDPNIVWAAEFEIDFMVDNKDSADRININSIKTIKLLDADSDENWDEPNFLSAKILNSAFQDKIEMFGESTLRQKVNSSILSKRDTVDLCISAMYLRKTILVYKVGAEEILRFRAKQIIFYNSQKNTFDVQTLAVALTKNLYDDAGNYMGITPVFWIKPTNNKEIDIRLAVS